MINMLRRYFILVELFLLVDYVIGVSVWSVLLATFYIVINFYMSFFLLCVCSYIIVTATINKIEAEASVK